MWYFGERTATLDRAGVGVVTLFRRFPTRDDLGGAVFADKMAAYLAALGSVERRARPASAEPLTLPPRLGSAPELLPKETWRGELGDVFDQ